MLIIPKPITSFGYETAFMEVFFYFLCVFTKPLGRRHDEHEGASNHRCLDCFLDRLFRRRSKKTSKLRVTGLCEGNPPLTGGFPLKRPVTWMMFPFDDIIMSYNDIVHMHAYLQQKKWLPRSERTEWWSEWTRSVSLVLINSQAKLTWVTTSMIAL